MMSGKNTLFVSAILLSALWSCADQPAASMCEEAYHHIKSCGGDAQLADWTEGTCDTDGAELVLGSSCEEILPSAPEGEVVDGEAEEDEAGLRYNPQARTAATLHYLGSSSFLTRCAGNTLGCGRRVTSVANSTPYFSAPRHWGRGACNKWYTFRANGRCVEAQRFEVSDTRHFLEGNPGLMRGLGISHGDSVGGRRCAGFGVAKVTIEPGRTC